MCLSLSVHPSKNTIPISHHQTSAPSATTRVPLSQEISSRLPHSAVIITCHVKVNSTQHWAAASTLYTFYPHFKAQLFIQKNSSWLAFKLLLHRNNQMDLHLSDFLLPTGSKLSGVPTGGRVNNCNPESTQMPCVCVCAFGPILCSNHSVKLWGTEGVHVSTADQTDGLEPYEVIGSGTMRSNLTQPVCLSHLLNNVFQRPSYPRCNTPKLSPFSLCVPCVPPVPCLLMTTKKCTVLTNVWITVTSFTWFCIVFRDRLRTPGWAQRHKYLGTAAKYIESWWILAKNSSLRFKNKDQNVPLQYYFRGANIT